MVSVEFENAKELLSSLDVPVWVLHREWEEDEERGTIQETRFYVGGTKCSVKFSIRSLLGLAGAITAHGVSSTFKRPDALSTYVLCYPKWQNVHSVSFGYKVDKTIIVTRLHHDGSTTEAIFHETYLESVMDQHMSFDVCDRHFTFVGAEIEPEAPKADFIMQTVGGEW